VQGDFIVGHALHGKACQESFHIDRYKARHSLSN
jgi:hypothetical protein